MAVILGDEGEPTVELVLDREEVPDGLQEAIEHIETWWEI